MVAAAGTVKPALAQTTPYANRPTRFVHFFVRSGSCQLSSYLSPAASTASLGSLPAGWKTPGIATSFRPSSPAAAALENVDLNPLGTAYGSQPNGSQPIFHARTQVGSYYMPLLWSSTIPVGTGTGTAPMRSLISSQCAMIYGLESAAAHPLAEKMMLDPEPGSVTIGGYISGVSGPAFFPAIANSGGVGPFKSASGAGIRIFQPNGNNGGPAVDLLRAVNPEPNETSTKAGRRAWFDQVRGKMLQSLESMRLSNMVVRPGISQLYSMLNQAQNTVDSALYAQVLSDFTATFNKYDAILNRAKSMATTQMQGITDPATVAANPVITRDFLRNFASTTQRSISQVNSLFANGAQLNVSQSFAYSFAMTEVALRHNLTHVLSLGFGEWMVSLRYVENISDSSKVNMGALFDNHERGVVANLISNAAFYYIFNTLLYELKRNVQGITSNPGTATNVAAVSLPLNFTADGSFTPPPPSPDPWRDTVILVNTEFSRNPDANGAGSQHGYNASCVTLLSGRLTGGLKIVGRTTYGTSQNNYPNSPGAWGRGSVQMNYQGRQISTKDVGANLAALFCPGSPPAGLATILARSAPLFSLDSNGNIVFNSQTLPAYGLVST
jgi:hypothetical protein